jgi:hypothetical protein
MPKRINPAAIAKVNQITALTVFMLAASIEPQRVDSRPSKFRPNFASFLRGFPDLGYPRLPKTWLLKPAK